MPLERIEHHPLVIREPNKLERFGKILATGGLSAKSFQPKPLGDDERETIESKGYDPEAVQPVIDWLERRGQTGEQAAATLRGAFNDLVERVNLQESADDPTP